MSALTESEAKNIIHEAAVAKEHCTQFCYPSIDKRLISINQKFWWLIALGVLTALDIGKIIFNTVFTSAAAALK